MASKSNGQKSKSIQSSGVTTVQAGASSSTNTPRCPYHDPILNLKTRNDSGYGQSPMERLLTDDPSQQSALIWRSDTDKLSTWKGCICAGVGKH